MGFRGIRRTGGWLKRLPARQRGIEQRRAELGLGPSSRRERIFYWISSVDSVTGKPALIGPYTSEAEAEQVGNTKLENDFQIIVLPTANTSMATHLMRAQNLHLGTGLHRALRRMRHKL